jgi:hypothetical protein
MKGCPSPETLVALTLGRVVGPRRRQLLRHVKNCAHCRKDLGQQVAVVTDLSSAEIDPGGLASLRLTEPRPELGREIQAAVHQARKDVRLRRHRLETLVDRLLAELFPMAPALRGELSALSFRTRSMGIAQNPPKEAAAKIQQRFGSALVSFLEKVVQPDVSPGRRARWLLRLSSELEQMRAEFPDRPATRSRVEAPTAKRRPKGHKH